MIAPVSPSRARRRGRFPVFLLVCLLAGVSPGALGATINVDTLEDVVAGDGQCSLREALVNANDDAQTHTDCEAGAGDDTIQLAQTQAMFDALTGDLELAGAELTVSDAGGTPGESLTIDGRVADPSSSDDPPPERTLTIDGGGSSESDASACVTEDSRVGRIFSIQTPATLTNLTLTNACVEGDGGIIFNASSLTLSGIDLSNGSALETTETDGRGGAVFNAAGATLIIDEDSQISSNLATRHGGGIANISTATIDPCPVDIQATCTIALDNAVLTSNQAGLADTGENVFLPGYGGGMHNAGGTVAARLLTATNNLAMVSGGGIWNSGTLDVISGTLQNNQAQAQFLLLSESDPVRGGGAIFNDGGTLSAEFTTISGNSVLHADNTLVQSLEVHGGAVASDGGTISLDTVGMSENQAGRSEAETQEGTTVPELPGLGGALYIGDGATLTIRDSSLIQNTAVAAGGGLWSAAGTSEAPTDIENTDFLANQAAEGGGLYHQGSAEIHGGRVSVNQGNSQDGIGGGILNTANAALTIENTQIGRNTAAFGAGIDNAGTLTLTRVFLGATQTESRNRAGADGGGLRNRDTGTAAIEDSTIAFNDAGAGDLGDNNGGGIWNAGTLTVTNSTFSENRALGGGNGGALFQAGSGSAALNFTTVADNSAEGDGAGVFAGGGSGITTASSILAGTSESHVSDDGNSLFTVSGLDDLKLFGGPLPTRPLTADSEAVDFVPNADCTENADQRGAGRPDGNASGGGDCDTGSFERAGAPVLSIEGNGPQQILVGTGGDVTIGEDLAVLAFSLTNDGGESVTVEGFDMRPLFNGGIEAIRRLVENDPDALNQLQFEVVLDNGANENAGNGILDDDETTVVGSGDWRNLDCIEVACSIDPAGGSEDFLIVMRASDTGSQTAGLLSAPPILAGGLLVGLLGLIRIRGLRRRVQWSFLVLLLTAGLAACSESTGIDELEPPAPPIPPTPDPALQGSLRFELFQLTPGTGEGDILAGDGLPVYGPAISLQ